MKDGKKKTVDDEWNRSMLVNSWIFYVSMLCYKNDVYAIEYIQYAKYVSGVVRELIDVMYEQ